jgi:NAD-dependent deacetylase
VDLSLPVEFLDRWTTGARVCVLTGAGVSAESGVPTFRGEGGLWKGRDPMTLATPEAYARDPELVWEFYDWRRGLISACEPNPAHRALAEIEDRVAAFTLVTQNVDGLHRLAGNRQIVEIHGNLFRVRCTGPGHETEDRRVPMPRPWPPACSCGAPLRPAVVWFGEGLDPERLRRAEAAAADSRVCLVIGTSSVVYPAAALPEIARAAGSYVVEVGPEPTPLTPHVPLSLRGPAGTVVPALLEALS